MVGVVSDLKAVSSVVIELVLELVGQWRFVCDLPGTGPVHVLVLPDIAECSFVRWELSAGRDHTMHMDGLDNFELDRI